MVYKNLIAIDPDGKRLVDIEVEKGKIKRVGRFKEEGEDLDGAWVLPALVDLSVALQDDRFSRANLKALCEAAKNGGVGAVLLRPDCQPNLNDEIHLEFIKTQELAIDVYPALMATKEEGLSEIATLSRYAKMIFAYSDTNSYLLARIFEYAKMLEKPLLMDVRNSVLKSIGVMNDGEVSFKLGLGGISKLEEYSEVAKIIEFSEFYGVSVIFGAVSTARALDLIAQSSRCYAQVSIHHLLKNESACEGYNTLAKVNPPLREEVERQKLLDALQSGKIDFLTSLHSPKSYTQKDLSFDDSAFGIDSVATYLPLAYTKLVKSGIISLEKLMEFTSANPAAKLGFKHGFVKCGYDAKLIRFDPEALGEGRGLYEGEEIYGKMEFL